MLHTVKKLALLIRGGGSVSSDNFLKRAEYTENGKNRSSLRRYAGLFTLCPTSSQS